MILISRFRKIRIHINFTSFLLTRRHTSRDYFRFTARSVPRQAWTLNPSLSYSSKKFSTNKINSWVVFGSQISCRYNIQWCKLGYFWGFNFAIILVKCRQNKKRLSWTDKTHLLTRKNYWSTIKYCFNIGITSN